MNNNKKIFIFLSFFFLGTFLGISIFSSFKFANYSLDKLFSKETIAANLTKSGNVSCNLALAWTPDFFFIGDSHTGSGWDFTKISKKLNGKVGACIIGGATFKNLIDLAEIYAKNVHHAPTIVVGGGPRQFWVGENSIKRESQVKEIFERMQNPKNFWAHTFPKIILFDSFKKGSYNRNKNKYQDLHDSLKHLNKERLINLLKYSSGKLNVLSAISNLLFSSLVGLGINILLIGSIQ